MFDTGRRVPESGLGAFQDKQLAHLGRPAVPQLQRSPLRDLILGVTLFVGLSDSSTIRIDFAAFALAPLRLEEGPPTAAPRR